MPGIRRIRGESITLATAVSVATVRGVPPGCNVLEFWAPSSTLELLTVGLGPRIESVFFYDASAVTYTELVKSLTDRNTSTGTGNAMNEMQTADYLYIGCDRQFRGVAIDVGNTNSAGTAAADWEFWNGSAWANFANLSDGTFSTRTLAQDGLATWDMPTTWAKTTVNNEMGLFWARMAVDAALTDTTVSLLEIAALMNTTVNSATIEAEGMEPIRYFTTNYTVSPFRLYFDPAVFGSVEFNSASITSACYLNWLYCPDGSSY